MGNDEEEDGVGGVGLLPVNPSKPHKQITGSINLHFSFPIFFSIVKREGAQIGQKIINLPGGQMNDPLLRKYFSLPSLPTTPSSPSRTF